MKKSLVYEALSAEQREFFKVRVSVGMYSVFVNKFGYTELRKRHFSEIFAVSSLAFVVLTNILIFNFF